MSGPGRRRATTNRRRGRPTRLTRDLPTALLRDVAAGTPIDLAAELRGVSKSLVLGWVRRGEARDRKHVAPIYRRFATRYRHARAIFHRALLGVILAALQGPPSAERQQLVWWWLLERGFPEFWGKQRERPQRSTQLVTVAAGVPTDATAHAVVGHIFGSVGPPPSRER